MKIIRNILILVLWISPLLAKKVDLKNSTLKWEATKKIGSGHFGSISIKSASVKFSGKKLKRAEFIIDMNSMTVDDLQGKWRNKFLSHIKSSDFFEVKKYPEARLLINKQIDKNTVSGNLTIKGNSKKVKIKFKRSGNTYKGRVIFDRTKFGIIYGSKSFFKNLVGDKIINDEVKVDFSIVLLKK